MASHNAQSFIVLRRLLGSLELLVGFLSLGLATLLLQVESKRRGSEGVNQTLGLLTVMTAGAMAMLVSKPWSGPLYKSKSKGIARSPLPVRGNKYPT